MANDIREQGGEGGSKALHKSQRVHCLEDD